MIIAYMLFAATLVRALLVRMNLASPTCARCALPLERQRLGEPVCRCKQQ